jgi:hypothetical protein
MIAMCQSRSCSLVLNFEGAWPAPLVVFDDASRPLFFTAIVSVREALYRVVATKTVRHPQPAAQVEQAVSGLTEVLKSTLLPLNWRYQHCWAELPKLFEWTGCRP